MKRDFHYIADLLEGFFKQRKIGKALRIIEESDITGWEVWFQIEFSYYLSQHESFPEWWREWPVEFDRRREKEKIFCRPDFIIRKKGWRQDAYAALEVKQHPEAAVCFSNMMKDIEKIAKIKSSSLDVRSFWVLGIHRKKSKSELRSMVVSRFEAAGLDYSEESTLIKYIPNSNYAYTIF